MQKAGWKTSEFWLTIAVDVAALATSLATVLPAKYAAAAGTVATGLYAISRGWAKSGAPKAS
jgi:hypothetical protein